MKRLGTSRKTDYRINEPKTKTNISDVFYWMGLFYFRIGPCFVKIDERFVSCGLGPSLCGNSAIDKRFVNCGLGPSLCQNSARSESRSTAMTSPEPFQRPVKQH